MNMNRDRLVAFVAALRKGDALTAKQISHRFNVANPRDLVYRARHDHGVDVTLDETVNSRGQIRRRYRLAA